MRTEDRKNAPNTQKNSIDFDIHGIVGIRLYNATDSDRGRIAYQLGQEETTLDREPDITIRFQEKIATPGLKYLGVNEAAFTEEGFYLLSSGFTKTKVRIPFDKIGGKCELLCENGIYWFPLLNLIITLTFMKKGYLPMHASGFEHKGTGVMVMGWKTGGKTEALLSFANHGARYVGDEWIFISPDGEKMCGIPAPTSIKEWLFEHIPNLMPKLGREKRILFKTVHFLNNTHQKLSKGKLKNFFPVKFLGQMLPAFKRQLKIWVTPRQFFKDQYCEGFARPEKLFLIMMDSDPNFRVEACDPHEIAARMHSSNMYELAPVFEFYDAFKYAFPKKRNDFLENLPDTQKAMLLPALFGKDAYKVYRPYPTFPLESLYKMMAPLCEQQKDDYKTEAAANIEKNGVFVTIG